LCTPFYTSLEQVALSNSTQEKELRGEPQKEKSIGQMSGEGGSVEECCADNTTETEKEPATNRHMSELDFSGNGFCSDSIHCEVITQLQKDIKKLRAKQEDQEKNLKAIENLLFYETPHNVTVDIESATRKNGPMICGNTPSGVSSMYNDLVRQLADGSKETYLGDKYVRFQTVDYSTMEQNKSYRQDIPNVEFEYVHESDILPRALKTTTELDPNVYVLPPSDSVVLLDLDTGNIIPPTNGNMPENLEAPHKSTLNEQVDLPVKARQDTQDGKEDTNVRTTPDGQEGQTVQSMSNGKKSPDVQTISDGQNATDGKGFSDSTTIQRNPEPVLENPVQNGDLTSYTDMEKSKENYPVVPVVKGILAKKSVIIIFLNRIFKNLMYDLSLIF